MNRYHPSFDRAIAAFEKRMELDRASQIDSEELRRAIVADRAYMQTMVRLLAILKEMAEFADLRVGYVWFQVFLSSPQIGNRFIHITSGDGGQTYDIWVADFEEVKFPNTELTVNHDEVISELKRYVSRLLAGEFGTDSE